LRAFTLSLESEGERVRPRKVKDDEKSGPAFGLRTASCWRGNGSSSGLKAGFFEQEEVLFASTVPAHAKRGSTSHNCEGFRLRAAWRRPSGLTFALSRPVRGTARARSKVRKPLIRYAKWRERRIDSARAGPCSGARPLQRDGGAGDSLTAPRKPYRGRPLDGEPRPGGELWRGHGVPGVPVPSSGACGR
jgi:hypothetical protein